MAKYIALEGIDGAGKSTQIALLHTWLGQRCYTAIHLFEPTYGEYGSQIRAHIDEGRELPVEKQIDLFTLDRKFHVRNKVRPLLGFVRGQEGFVILQDRCYLSAPAYQAVGRRSMISLLRQQQSIAPSPDMIFLIDVPIEQALQRQARSSETPALFSSETELRRIRENYLFLATEGSERIVTIDGSGLPLDVNARIVDVLRTELE